MLAADGTAAMLFGQETVVVIRVYSVRGPQSVLKTTAGSFKGFALGAIVDVVFSLRPELWFSFAGSHVGSATGLAPWVSSVDSAAVAVEVVDWEMGVA